MVKTMLLGQYSTNFSKEKRVAIPKKLRGKLGDIVIVARWYEGCLVMISQQNWQKIVDKLTGTTQFVTAPVRDTDRFIMGSAYELAPDSQGRMVLPDHLAEYAKLDNEVVFLGLGDRVEIWNKAEWEKREAYINKNAADFVEQLANDKGVVSG